MQKTLKRNLILPFRGEFGMKIFHHVPHIYTINSFEKIVICEKGDEALYPGASKYISCERKDDYSRRDTVSNDKIFMENLIKKHDIDAEFDIIYPKTNELPKKFFVPKPHIPVEIKTKIDVVICPRKRKYGKEKNWPYWGELIQKLQEERIEVFAAGAPDSSLLELGDVIECAWQFNRFLDATISAFLKTNIVITTDCGLAHLASICGCSIIMISYEDNRVSPGPVRDETGKVLRKEYWKINTSFYEQENHLASFFKIIPNSWNDLRLILKEVTTQLKQLR